MRVRLRLLITQQAKQVASYAKLHYLWHASTRWQAQPCQVSYNSLYARKQKCGLDAQGRQMSSCCARKSHLELCASLAANKRIALKEGVYTCETCASADNG